MPLPASLALYAIFATLLFCSCVRSLSRCDNHSLYTNSLNSLPLRTTFAALSLFFTLWLCYSAVIGAHLWPVVHACAVVPSLQCYCSPDVIVAGLANGLANSSLTVSSKSKNVDTLWTLSKQEQTRHCDHCDHCDHGNQYNTETKSIAVLLQTRLTIERKHTTECHNRVLTNLHSNNNYRNFYIHSKYLYRK